MQTEQTPTVTLAAGTLRVEVGDVPRLIARALYPPDACNGPVTVIHLTKVVNGTPRGERPTAKELDTLNRTVWAKLPPYADGITAEKWAHYDEAFRAAKDRPTWELMPTLLNPAYNGEGGAMMRVQAEAEHQVLLGKALVEGRITVITHAGAPVLNPFIAHGVYVSVRALERYLSELPLPLALRIGEPEVQEPAPLARAVPVGQQHAQTVLDAICAAGYDPMALPPTAQGKPGVKAAIRGQCELTDAQFDHAWKALRAAGRIKERD
ncbi:MAG: hypothetical protein ACP5NM_12185 [Thiomonas sp.]